MYLSGRRWTDKGNSMLWMAGMAMSPEKPFLLIFLSAHSQFLLILKVRWTPFRKTKRQWLILWNTLHTSEELAMILAMRSP
jgi:hypothetical protein